MAGVLALINQKTGATQGFANPELYKLAAAQTYASCSAETVTAGSTTCMFNDIDQETNAMPCDAADSTPNCTASYSTLSYSDSEYGLGILTGYSATTGFDLATGLGSLNVANVVNAWTAVTPGSAAPTITVTPSPTSINSSNTLSVTVTVGGATGAPKDPNGQTIAPTGTVTLSATNTSGGTYSASGTVGSNGSVTFTIPAGTLPGTTGGQPDTLTASYAGDVNYSAKTGTGSVTVTVAVLPMPAVSVTASPTSIDTNATLTVTVSVTGSNGSPNGGTVTISGDGYTSPSQTIGTSSGCTSNTSCVFTIPVNTLSASNNAVFTATYGGNSFYQSNTGTSNAVTVTESSFTLTPGTPSSSSVTPGQSATVTVTAAPTAGYSGTVTLTCAQTSTTATGGDGTTCSPSGSSQINLATCGASCSVTFTIGTYAKVTAALDRPRLPGSNGPGGRDLLGAGSGAILALLVFFGIPARRRSWRSMLSILVAMVAIGTLASCGGGSSGGGCTSNCVASDPGTTAGTYTYTVTASASPSVTPTVTATFTVTVN
jgi:hypothetical protein